MGRKYFINGKEPHIDRNRSNNSYLDNQPPILTYNETIDLVIELEILLKTSDDELIPEAISLLSVSLKIFLL